MSSSVSYKKRQHYDEYPESADYLPDQPSFFPSTTPTNQPQTQAPTRPEQSQLLQGDATITTVPMATTPVCVTAAAGASSSSSPVVSMAPALVLSCLVFWFCGCLFGGIALILAMIGHNSARSGKTEKAIRLRRASLGLSITGVVVGVIIIGVVAGLKISSGNT